MFLQSVTLLYRFKRQKLHCLLVTKNCWRHFFCFSNDHHMKTGIEQLFTYMQWSTMFSCMEYSLCHASEHMLVKLHWSVYVQGLCIFFSPYNNLHITLTVIFNGVALLIDTIIHSLPDLNTSKSNNI